MEKLGEIRDAVNSFRNDINYMKIRERWHTDLDLYRGKPYDAGKGYMSYTSNSPRIYADKIISMVIASNLTIRIPEETLTDQQAKLANNAERFLYGALAVNDERMIRESLTPNLRQQWAWFAGLRGAVAFRVYVYKNKQGQTICEIKPWDIYNVAYGMGDGGLAWAAHTYTMTKEQIKRKFGKDIGSDSAEVIDFWDTEKYGVIVGDTFGQEFKEHGLDHTPVFIIPVGATPLVSQINYQHTPTLVGESLYAPNRDLYPILNKSTSDLLTIVRRGVKPPIGVYTASGESPIEQDIWQVEKGGIISLRHGDEIKAIMPPAMPQDGVNMLNILVGDIQRGSLAHTSYGELSGRLSGYAINQLYSAMETVVMPVIYSLERAYEITSLELLEQYTTKKNLPAFEVRGRNSRNEPFGYAQKITISPEELAGEWRPEVKLLPVLPKDDAQRYQLATLARTVQPGQEPLLSDETIREELLGIRDPMLENQKVNRQWADSLIINKLWKAYMAALAEGDPMVAQNILTELRRMMMAQSGVQQGQAPPLGQIPTEQESMGMPGAGLPARRTGVPSATMPPEAMGGMPPGSQNARMPGIAETEV